MSKNNKSKKHTPRKPRPSELAAKAKKAAPKRGPGRPPEERKAFDYTTMVRMFKTDHESFTKAATKLANVTGSPVSVGAFLRMAARAWCEAHTA